MPFILMNERCGGQGNMIENENNQRPRWRAVACAASALTGRRASPYSAAIENRRHAAAILLF